MPPKRSVPSGGTGSGISYGKDEFGLQDEHSDDPGTRDILPQSNGGVPVRVTQFQSARPHEYEDTAKGERNLGDMGKDEFGSMNGKAAGKIRGEGGVC